MNLLAEEQIWHEIGSSQANENTSSQQQEKSGQQHKDKSSPRHKNESQRNCGQHENRSDQQEQNKKSSPQHQNESHGHCGQQENKSKIEHKDRKTRKRENRSSHEKLWPNSNKSFTELQSKHNIQVLDIERSYVNTGFSEEEEFLDSTVEYKNIRAKSDLVQLSGAQESRLHRGQEQGPRTANESSLHRDKVKATLDSHQGQVRAKLDCLSSWHSLSDAARNDEFGTAAVKQQMTSKESICTKTSEYQSVRDMGPKGQQGRGKLNEGMNGQGNGTLNGINDDNSLTEVISEKGSGFIELMLQNLTDTDKYTDFFGNEKGPTKREMQIDYHKNSFQNELFNAEQNDDVYEKMYGHENPLLQYDWPRTQLKTQILDYFEAERATGLKQSDTEYLDICGYFVSTGKGVDETMPSSIYDVIDEQLNTPDAARITGENTHTNAARYVCMERSVQRTVTREMTQNEPLHDNMKRNPQQSARRTNDRVARAEDGKGRAKRSFARKSHDSVMQDKSLASGYHLQRYNSYPAIISSQKPRMERHSRCKDRGGRNKAPRPSDSLELKRTEDAYDYESDEDQTTVSWPTLLRKSKHIIAASTLLMLIVICTVTILSLLLWHEHI